MWKEKIAKNMKIEYLDFEVTNNILKKQIMCGNG